MRINNKFLSGIFAFLLILSFLSIGCYIEIEGEDEGYYEYDITFVLSKAEGSQKTVYVILTRGSTCEDAVAYETSGTMNWDGEVSATINDVEEGTYTACVMIDFDDNADIDNPIPNNGDYTAEESNVYISGDQYISFEGSDWLWVNEN